MNFVLEDILIIMKIINAYHLKCDACLFNRKRCYEKLLHDCEFNILWSIQGVYGKVAHFECE